MNDMPQQWPSDPSIPNGLGRSGVEPALGQSRVSGAAASGDVTLVLPREMASFLLYCATKAPYEQAAPVLNYIAPQLRAQGIE